MRHVKSVVFCVVSFISCTNQGPDERINEYIISDISVFIGAEMDDFVGTPVRIEASDDGLYFIDEATFSLTKVNWMGEKVFALGHEGPGPGEFQSMAEFWIFDDQFLIYDYNGSKFVVYDDSGYVEDILVRSNPANPNGFPPRIPITVEAVSTHQILIPSRGYAESLFALVDIKSNSVQYFAEAIGEHVQNYNSDEILESYKTGKIPDIFENAVELAANSTGIFSLQQTTGILEKYNYEGELIWSMDLKIPAQENLFDQFAEVNRARAFTNERPFELYFYSLDMYAHQSGVAVLLNVPNDHAISVVWVSNDGTSVEFVSLPSMSLVFGDSIVISPDKANLFLLKPQDGLIYKAKWPI
jgi:hypothetical protein